MKILSTCELRSKCPEQLKEPTFLQFKNVLLVQTGRNFYIFDFLKQQWTKLNTKEEAPVPVKDAMILMPNSKNIYLMMNKQIVHYDTIAEHFTVEKTQFDGRNCTGFMISETEFLCLKDNDILLVSLDGKSQTPLYHHSDMQGCTPCYSGDYIMASNLGGELEVFESELSEQAHKFRPYLQVLDKR